MKIECVLECGNHLGEGPVWDVESGCLYWLDGTGRRVGNRIDFKCDVEVNVPGEKVAFGLACVARISVRRTVR